MTTEKKFRTKTGFCHIFPDKIILTRDGEVGDLSKLVVGDNISRFLIIYSLLAVYIIFNLIKEIKEGDNLSTVFYVILLGLWIYVIVKSLNNSATPIIFRKDIIKTTFIPGVKYITRSRFEVLFRNEKGNIKKRLILLPGSLTGGDAATEEALQIMQEEGLI